MIHFPVPEVEALCRREQAERSDAQREPAAEILSERSESKDLSPGRTVSTL